jgi:RNA polymerase sigma-70 factor (ECF subfamily)
LLNKAVSKAKRVNKVRTLPVSAVNPNDMTSPSAVESAPEVQDVDLVKRAQGGDARAFDALVTKYRGRVYSMTYSLVQNDSDAWDLAQEAFIKAWRALPGFKHDSSFYTWLYRIAINTAKNAAVARSRSPVEYDLDLQNSDESYELQARMADHDTPEALAMAEEIRMVVEAAIDSLPEELRTAIVLRELDGQSYEAIAATMACPVGTVRSRIFRAREVIDRRLLQVFEGGLGRVEESA